MVRSAICPLLGLVLFFAPASARAQVFFQMGQQSNSGRLVEPPRSVLQSLREAERAIEQQRPSDAVVILGDLLQRQPSADDDDDLSGQDFFLDVGDPAGELGQRRVGPAAPRGDANNAGLESPVRKTLFGEARRLLGSLPAAAIETYELRYGVDARELLQRGRVQRDWSAVAEVRRRFFHTRAGLDATRLLALRAITEGRPWESLRLLEAVLTHPALAAADRETAEQLIADLRRSAADTFAAGAGEPSPDGDAAQTPAGTLRVRHAANDGDIRMFGGGPQRHEGSAGQLPLSIPRWLARTAETPSQQRVLEEAADSLAATGDFPPPAWLPIKVGNQVLARSVGHLFGIDFQTGKVIWQDPWHEGSPSRDAADPTGAILEEESAHMLLKQRVWNDLPYGRITSDGKRVYLLSDLSDVELTAFNSMMGFQGVRPTESTGNSLVALDIATEGKLIWRIGGRTDRENGWGDIFFLGPPLPLGDALYVMAETAGDIVLICLDAATGLERWRQQLVAMEAGRVQSDPIRRIAGATPSYHQGVLVCSTGAGAILGIDLLDQSLIWGLRFERNEAMSQQLMGGRRDLSPDQLLQRWWDGTPRIVGDTIYVTPIESDRLFAIDLLTGEKRWKEVPRTQTNSRHLAGVRDGAMILLGSDHVRGADTRSGQRLWETPAGWLEAGEWIAGIGVFGTQAEDAADAPQAAYFVPTTAGRILAISLEDGRVLASRSTQFPLGNLVAVEGQLLSQSATYLAAVHGEQALSRVVEASLEADPDDFRAVVWQAELLLQDGKLEEALRWLHRAREMDPEDVHVENLSIRVMLNALRDDFAANIGLLPELEQLIDRPSDAVELRKLQVRAALEANDRNLAVRRLIELSRLVAASSPLSGFGKLGSDDSTRQVSLDQWLAARVSEVFEGAEEPLRAEMNAEIAGHLDDYQGATSGSARLLLTHFGRTAGAESLRQVLLDRYREDGEYLPMERLLLAAAGATTDTPDRLAPDQLESLIETYARGGLTADAEALWAALPADQQTEATAERLGLGEILVNGEVAVAVDPWGPEVTLRVPQETTRVPSSMMGRLAVGKTRRMVGRSFRGWRAVSDLNSPLGLRDPLGTIFPVPLDGRREDSPRQAVFSGGLMIAMLPGELVGVNLFEATSGQTDPVVWRRPWRTDGSGGARPASSSNDFGDPIHRFVIGSTADGSAGELVLGPIVGDSFYILQGSELLAYDALSGEPRWRNLVTPRSGTILCDGDVVAIVSPASRVVSKYDCRDGRLLSTEPFEQYQIWAATDSLILANRELPDGQHELVLLDPIADREVLRHTYEKFTNDRRVLGRVIDGTYVVTLANTGELLIWDLQQGRLVCETTIDPIPKLRRIHVVPRDDMLVILPDTGETPADRSAVAFHTQSGQDHVRVDGSVIAISTRTGERLWQVPLGVNEWGCTLTQAPGSPLLVLSRSQSRYVNTGSRVKTLDLIAIDTRSGRPIELLEHPIESFNNDIETTLSAQPAQQRVTVAIGRLRFEYQFQEAAIKDEANDAKKDDANEGEQEGDEEER